jgi:ketosteroid isomerase-like protein
MPNRTGFAVFCLLLTTASQAVEITGGSAADRKRMAEISAEWLDAYANGDLDALMAIMHDDAMVMPHNQATTRGTVQVREFFSGRIGRPGVKFIDNLQEIRINGSWAYVLGTFKLEISVAPDKPPMLHNGRYLVLYEKTGGQWQMLRDMDNVDPVTSD